MKKEDKILTKLIKLKNIYDKEKSDNFQKAKKKSKYKLLVKLYEVLELGIISRKEFDYIVNKIYD